MNTPDSEHDLATRVPRILERWTRGGTDRRVIDLVAEIQRTLAYLDSLLSADSRDTDEIPGFDAAADDLARMIVRLCDEEASWLDGMLAKAELAEELASSPGDKAERIALSLARDLHSAARSEHGPQGP